MPSYMLFGVNNEGKVLGISTNGKIWREFPYVGLEFKQISTVPNFLWAIGGDRQVYLHVHGLDIPIRVKEETYENERWNPIRGFEKQLLPTDRSPWSSEDGLISEKKEDIRLPSMAWQWETDWQLELTLNGYPLDNEGWTYALDFSSTFSSQKQWTSCVRRRKWYRYRRYAAMYSWCAIPPLHNDPTKEPFKEIAVGGQNKTSENNEALSVWAVTSYGRLMFRHGVSDISPDGSRWLNVQIMNNTDVRSISCAATGVLWAILDNGTIAVRHGVTTHHRVGKSWREVSLPKEGAKFIQLSVGTNSVWAISDDDCVWYRKSIRSEEDFSAAELSKDSWIKMVGEMSCISVAANDQVWAIKKHDKRIYFRTGVTNDDLMGKKWRLMEARTQKSSSSLSLSSYQSDTSSTDTSDVPVERTSSSAPPCLEFCSRESSKSSVDSSNKKIMRSWSPTRSGSSLLGMEANPDTDDRSLDLDIQKLVFGEKDDISKACEENKTLWSYVCAGAVNVNYDGLPKWFIDEAHSRNNSAPWRNEIVTKLKKIRDITESPEFAHYKPAIETTSWIKSSKCKCSLPESYIILDCVLKLDWIENVGQDPDSGTLSILSSENNQLLLILDLLEIMCALNCSDPNVRRFTVNTMKSIENNMKPLELHFQCENDFEDWLQIMSTVCCQVNGIKGLPSKHSTWCTNELDDIYVFDPLTLEKSQRTENGYFSELNVKNLTVPFSIPLVNGFTVDSEITINGFVPKNSDRFFINFICGCNNDIAFHFNPRIKENVIVRNSSIGNEWGCEERDGKLSLKPGSDFTLAVLCLKPNFKVFINGIIYTYYNHRISPDYITEISIGGRVDIFNILYQSPKVIYNLQHMFWRKISGHLAKIETCNGGVTWGIGDDGTPWVYTGSVVSSASMAGIDQLDLGTFTMTDHKDIYVYENQRWNPITGFTTRGLPTDRHMWSDETGNLKLTKESVKLENRHWQWITDWEVDYKTPGGVDEDGWQYAVDFPASYHSYSYVTDTVRRRRWIRTCKLVITGPWKEVGNTKLKNLSLTAHQDNNGAETISVWGVTVNGEVLFRKGVSVKNPSGEMWDHVPTDQAITNISGGSSRQIWCCGENGASYWRFGITESNQMGVSWELSVPPVGCLLKMITVSKWSVWAIDVNGLIYARKQITPVHSEATSWYRVTRNDIKLRHISACDDNIWGITMDGVICKRIGITEASPEGVSWTYGMAGNWRHVTE